MCNYSHFGLSPSSLTVTCLLKTKIGITHEGRDGKSSEIWQNSPEIKQILNHIIVFLGHFFSDDNN